MGNSADTMLSRPPHKRIINWAACGEQGALVASLACKFRLGGGVFLGSRSGGMLSSSP